MLSMQLARNRNDHSNNVELSELITKYPGGKRDRGDFLEDSSDR